MNWKRTIGLDNLADDYKYARSESTGYTLNKMGEMLGRYLFFVSVVPKNIAAGFTAGIRSAA